MTLLFRNNKEICNNPKIYVQNKEQGHNKSVKIRIIFLL
jgi:hypothetical protein